MWNEKREKDEILSNKLLFTYIQTHSLLLIRIIVQWYDKLNYFVDSFQSVTRNTRPNFFFWYFSLYLRFLSMNSLNSTMKKKWNNALNMLVFSFQIAIFSFPFKIISRFVNSKIMIYLMYNTIVKLKYFALSLGFEDNKIRL